ncbi:Acyl-CoA N-acyltransferase [Pleurostoma richardsiae]|uniref:Acyl-CoA N-acyltransferase n=1 Tax=Pleurostoma richardsiae TaxID=41990 RepID=A0AA38VUZ1_9PEZI|nr:Acyl-CoA N-acyltransferase [Pleurostoma richardsiae]
MAIEIHPLTESDIPSSVHAIQEAFADDPYNNWIFDKSEFNPKRNAASLAIRMRWGIRNGLFYVAKEPGNDKVLGVAMWLLPKPAGQNQSWYDWFEDWRLWFDQVRMNVWYGRGGLNVKRYYIWKAGQEKAHSAVWTDPRGYYFLNIMVVIPEAQRRGIGKQLVSVVTDRADAEGMPCYLESSKDKPNTQIYERMGFKFAEALDCDDAGDVCKLYCMVREPRASSA